MIDGAALGRSVRSALVLLTMLVLQLTLLSDLRIAGAQADVMLLVGIAAGLAAGPERGAVLGFAAGLSYDLLLTTPLGLSALAYAIAGFVAGQTREAFLRAAWWIPAATAAATSALGVILYVVAGTLVGQSTAGIPLATVVIVVSVLNGLLSPAAVRVLRWAIADDDRRLALR